MKQIVFDTIVVTSAALFVLSAAASVPLATFILLFVDLGQ